MKKSSRLKLYYQLFSLLIKYPRISGSEIAKYFHHTGRGRSPSTYLHHIQSMYSRQISKPPQIAPKSFLEYHLTTYFCTNNSGDSLYDLFEKLSQNRQITYVIALTSKDFFIVSQNDNLNLKNYQLEIDEKSILYTPIYVIPKGWNQSMNQAFNNFLTTEFKRGLLPRTLYRNFGWDSLDWDIFEIVHKDIKSFSYTKVARRVDSTPNTVRNRFLEKILPNCVQINYFFPKGYNSYWQLFLKIDTDYESSIIKALEKLPSSSYVFPLDKCLIIVLFYEEIKDVLLTLKKMKNRNILETCSIYNCLACTV